MGDTDQQGGQADLWFLPHAEVTRLLEGLRGAEQRMMLACIGRYNALYMIKRAGSGHIGSSFSSMDIMATLLTSLRGGPISGQDLFFSSKGHDAPALYAVLSALGHIPDDDLHRLRRLGGLPGHAHVGTPGVIMDSGSLGMGISKAKGLIHGARYAGKHGRVVVLMGDGEMQEGQVWEALPGAVRDKLGELLVIVDCNAMQSDTFVADVLPVGDLAARFAATGWHSQVVDGHDVAALDQAIAKAWEHAEKPSVIIGQTIKGRGVTRFEGSQFKRGELYPYHSGAPSDTEYTEAEETLREAIKSLCTRHARPGPQPVRIAAPAHRHIQDLVSTVDAYAQELCRLARDDTRIIALDADLVRDCGLIPFRSEFPDRFLECGIAEQDMVSMASGLAARGLVPVCHSFAAFLTGRPNEQIGSNCLEGRKVVYVGSLAGLLPGGPGHSHQSVRDVAAMAAMPNLTIVQPGHPDHVAPLLEWTMQDAGSVYLRLCSLRWPLPAPPKHSWQVGRGAILRQGTNMAIFAAGPVMISQALAAAEELAADGLGVTVVDFPWLNRVDPEWFSEFCAGTDHIFVAEEHYRHGGLTSSLTLVAAEHGLPTRIQFHGLKQVPRCGGNDEVLEFHGMGASGLADAVRRRASQIPPTVEPRS